MLHHFEIPEDFILDHRFINYCFKNDEEDELYWERWITDHPEKRELVDEARHLVLTMSVRVPSEEKQAGWEKMPLKKRGRSSVSTTTSKKSPIRMFYKGSRGVAVLLLLIALWWFVDQNKEEPSTTIQQEKSAVTETSSYITHYGEKQKITLKDGTKVWLNADSKLDYGSHFETDDKRIVTLSGEAYFEVSQQADKPFIVRTKEMNVIVLGTSFNVKAYPKDEAFTTTLINGSVKVQLKADSSKKIQLQPEEKLSVFNRSKKAAIHKISDSLLTKETIPKFSVSEVYKDPHLDDKILETIWREGKLAFRDERFGALALQLNHRYGVTFHFENQEIKGYRYTGIFTEESLKEALKALQLTSPSHPFTYRIENKEVFISKPIKNK